MKNLNNFNVGDLIISNDNNYYPYRIGIVYKQRQYEYDIFWLNDKNDELTKSFENTIKYHFKKLSK